MITGRVQINESIKPREIEVGSAFARKEKDQWKSLDGKTLHKIEVKDIINRIKKKTEQEIS